jgi:hypothetical protein
MRKIIEISKEKKMRVALFVIIALLTILIDQIGAPSEWTIKLMSWIAGACLLNDYFKSKKSN